MRSVHILQKMTSLLWRDHDCISGSAVAARNGLWVTLRCRPYCAAAVKPDYTTGCHLADLQPVALIY